MIEVEAKVFVKHPEAIRKKAGILGKFIGKEEKIDDYYTLESLKKRPEKSLRIRKVDGYHIVNFKKPEAYARGVWAKKEVEFRTSNIADFLRLMHDFGFRKWLTKEKVCEIFEIKKNFHIELNNVKGLGWFIEVEYLAKEKNVETARKEVYRVLRELGYSKKDTIKAGYTKQLWDKKYRR
jgi:predicted adenylyl cyclase CyaB